MHQVSVHNYIYVAAPWECRESARVAAQKLVEAGCAITHDWWNHEGGYKSTTPLQHAQADVHGVLACDTLFYLNIEPSEGKMFEAGIAYYANKSLIAVGSPSHMFHHLGEWMWFSNIDAAVEFIRESNR